MSETNKDKKFGQGDVKPDIRNMDRNQNQRERRDNSRPQGGERRDHNRQQGAERRDTNRPQGGERRDNNNRPQGGRNQNNENQHWHRKDYVKEKLEEMSGPTTNLQARESQHDKKFSGRCRLFVGNLPTSTTDEEFRKMFEKFGEIGEIFLHKQKGFGFVNLDTRQNAENARASLDFSTKDGRQIRVRFASHAAALKVKNLSPWVSNELLENAFSVFGDVERAVVIVDDRGRPVGEGIVEYARKQAAQLALKRCSEGCYLLTSSPRPVTVEPLEHRDEEDGLPEKNFQKGNKQYHKEREAGPRLAEPGTFEYEFANRWKKLYDLEQQKREYLDKEIEEGRRALDDQMEFAMYDHEANLLRERLRHMEEQSTMIQRERELRRDEELRREEARRQQEMLLRQQQEEILRNDLRRRQEESMMMQGYGDIMDRQEAAIRKIPSGGLSPSISADPSSGMGYGNGMIPGAGHPSDDLPSTDENINLRDVYDIEDEEDNQLMEEQDRREIFMENQTPNEYLQKSNLLDLDPCVPLPLEEFNKEEPINILMHVDEKRCKEIANLTSLFQLDSRRPITICENLSSITPIKLVEERNCLKKKGAGAIPMLQFLMSLLKVICNIKSTQDMDIIYMPHSSPLLIAQFSKLFPISTQMFINFFKTYAGRQYHQRTKPSH